jgi:4-hydroxybenzoate polyprenyltransferase
MTTRRTLVALLHLTRYQQNWLFALVLTVLGVVTAGAPCNAAAVLALIANWCAIAFAFMVNNIADAADDRGTAEKCRANPVSMHTLSPGAAGCAAGIVAAISLALFALLSARATLAGLGCILLGVVYSWRRVRLKSIPCLDVFSHALMLGVLPYWAAVWACAPQARPAGWLALLIGITSAYGQIYNQVRDLDDDRRAGLRTSAMLLGVRPAWCLLLLLPCAIAAGVAYALATGLVPAWLRVPATGAGAITIVYVWQQRRQPSRVLADRFHWIILVLVAASALAWWLTAWAGAPD